MGSLSEFESILIAFYKAGVEYILTGGFAVNFHGYNRSTSDLDIWVKPAESNKPKIINALIKNGYPAEIEKLIGQLNFSQPFAFSLGTEPIDIDVFNHITGVTFNDADLNKPFKYNENLIVNYISVKDLILNKMLTGRAKDKADVDTLQQIIKIRKK